MSFRNQGGEASKPLMNNNALYSSPYSTIPNSSSLPLEKSSSCCTKWKEQVKGWKRIVSHILAVIIILSVLGFAGAYFGEHDLKGAPTWKLGLLMLVSVSFGFVLIQGAFGFGAHFRVLYKQQYEPVMIELKEESEDEEKKMKSILPPSKVLPQFSTMQAHAVMIAIATFLFSMLYIIDKAAGWKMYAPEASPMTISIILGGFFFGFGMQLGDACASGTLFTIGAGSLWSVFLLVFFVAGSVIATALQSAGDWNISFPNHVGLSLLFPGTFLKKGFGINYLQKHAWLEYLIAVFAMCTQISILLAFAIGVYFYNKKKQKEASKEGLINQGDDEEVQLSTFQKIKEFFSDIIFKLIYGPWDIMTTGIALAFLNFFFLLITQHPMGLTGPFAIIGCKILDAIAPGLNVPGWSAWKGTDLRKANMLFNPNFILDFGIIYGAIIATLLKGKFPSFLDGMSLKSFAPKRTDENGDRASLFFTVSNYISRFVDWVKDNFGIALAKIIGGIAMGVGAKFGYGCNIGAYFSGVSCLSIHGYAWIIMAMFGGYLGAVARPYFGYKKRKVACGVCTIH